MKHNQTFFVDIGETMIRPQNFGTIDAEDKQQMFCKCGHHEVFDFKIKRSLVKNFDELIEGDKSIDSVTCSNCKRVYTDKNKVFLITPDKEEIFKIKFYVEKEVIEGEEILVLNKKRFIVVYEKDDKTLKFREDVDYIKINKNTNKSFVYLNNSFNYQNSNDNNTEEIPLDITNIKTLQDYFFKYVEYVKYIGLEEAFNFLNQIDPFVSDLEKFKTQIPPLEFLYDNNEIVKEENEFGDEVFYQMVDSGFCDGKKIKKSLNFGDYLNNLSEVSKIYFSVISFPNITTIILTKKYSFFRELIHSNNICKPDVYLKHDATYPNKIIEVSTNYNQDGTVKGSNQEGKNIDIIKISNVIYKNINSPVDMDILLDTFRIGILSKQDIEFLFQKYEEEKVYKFFRNLEKNYRRLVDGFGLKNICHILDNNLDTSKGHNVLEIYCDTMNAMSLMDIPLNNLFKLKTYDELKNYHDETVAKFQEVKDKKKAELFEKITLPFVEDINCVVNDYIKFEVITSLGDLYNEGQTMNHCINTYLNQICDGKYLAVKAYHTISKERGTLGFYKAGSTLEFDQLKGYRNSRATKEMIDGVITLCNDHKISYRNSSGDLSPDKGRIVKMSSYLSDKEVESIKNKLEAEKEKKNKKNKSEKNQNNSDESKKSGFIGSVFGL